MQKRNKKTIILSLIIILLIVLLWHKTTSQPIRSTGPELGKPGTEVFNQDTPTKTKENKGTIGTSIPVSLQVIDSKATITIKNTGVQPYVAYTTAGTQEVYRSSRYISQGEKVSAVISIPSTVDTVKTYLETSDGEKFAVKTKLVR